jgi:hypothetical protein
MIEQDSQKSAFLNALKKKGVKSGTEAADAWAQYKDQYPVIDDKGEIVKENIDMWRHIIGENSEAKPPGYSSKEAWIKDTQAANPGASKAEILDLYDQKYGG